MPIQHNIIGLCGRAGAGKDTAAEALSIYLGGPTRCTVMSFAGPLKEACAAMFGVPIVHFHDRKVKEMENEFWGMSPRKMCQIMGTEVARDMFDKDFWIKRMKRAIDLCSTHYIIITDCRYMNEVEFVLDQHGTIMYIDADERLGPLPEDAHVSEREQYAIRDKFNGPDVRTPCVRPIKNNGDLDSFITAVKEWMEELHGLW